MRVVSTLRVVVVITEWNINQLRPGQDGDRHGTADRVYASYCEALNATKSTRTYSNTLDYLLPKGPSYTYHSSKYRNPGPYTPYNISIQCNIKMFATNNRRSPRDNNDGLRIVDDHSRPLHFVSDLAFVQEEHGRGVYASDLVEVYAISQVCA